MSLESSPAPAKTGALFKAVEVRIERGGRLMAIGCVWQSTLAAARADARRYLDGALTLRVDVVRGDGRVLESFNAHRSAP